jgi:nucleotide-binding universal stress UspA family protein
MLALSTFRQSDKAVALALEKAQAGKKLVIVHVADVNLARYLIGTDIGLYPELKEKCEEELLREHEQKGQEKAEFIARRARAAGLDVATYVRIGRFAPVCLEIVGRERPSLVVTTRSRRPAWVKKFFGSPVDYLVAHAGCPVIEA